MPITVDFEKTPNPESMKYSFSEKVCEESATYQSLEDAQYAPLVAKIFGFPWTQEIFLGPDFLTVTKQDWVEWDVLAEPLKNLIQEHFDRNEPVLIEQPKEVHSENDSPQVKRIKEIIQNEIRPAVAMDGGDIVFADYKEGIVSVRLLGACSGCPSSTMTLKAGVEARIKHHLPEVKEVISI